MTSQKSETAACDLTAFTSQERARHLLEGRALQKEIRGFMNFDGRLEIYFDRDMDTARLLNWAQNEKRCCAFLSSAAARRERNRVVFSLHAPGAAARIWSETFLGASAAGGIGSRLDGGDVQ